MNLCGEIIININNMMNSYQLIFKLIKVRADTYLTPADQALFHELVAQCNELRWKEVFFVRSNVLCGNLNMSDNTLRKSRKTLADANLLFFETSRDKRIGCFYSFVQKLSNDVAAPAISSAVSSAIFEDDPQVTPIIDNIKTINEESHAHTREAPPPGKPRPSRKKEADAPPLGVSFHLDTFPLRLEGAATNAQVEEQTQLRPATLFEQARKV